MKKVTRIAGAGIAMLMVVATLAAPAAATNIGQEGCTPGYWKNHTDNWWEDPGNTIRSYETDDLFGDIFGVDYDVTLIEALQGGGGPGIDGAQAILARSATAAILNAAHEGLGYPLRRFGNTADGPAIIASVQAVWDSGDRQAILDLAASFDGFNNLGCPLN